MKRNLLILAGILAAVAVYLLVPSSGPQPVTFTNSLGSPGPHSPDARLPQLAMEVEFDQTNARILTRQENGDVLAWDTNTGTSKTLAKTEELFSYCRAKGILIITEDGRATVVNVKNNERRKIDDRTYHHAAWNKECSRLALANNQSGEIRIIDTKDWISGWATTTLSPPRNGIAMSADGQFVAVAEGTYADASGHDTSLEMFRISEDGSMHRAFVIDPPATILGMWKMVFAGNPAHLFVGAQVSGKSGLRSFPADTGNANWTRSGFTSYWVRAIAASPDGKLLASGDEEGWLRIWDARTGDKLYEGRTGLVIQSASFSDDGKRLAISLWDSTIGIVEIEKLLD